MKRIAQLPVVLFLLLAIGLSACSNFGKKVKVEGTKAEVFYKEGVSESEAKKVGDVLKDGFFANDKEASIQVVKEKGGYTVRFVYDKDYYEKNPAFEKDFKEYAVKISKEVFNGEKVNIALADKQFKDFTTIPFEQPEVETALAPAAPADGPVVKDEFDHDSLGGINFYWKGITDEESKTIAEYIAGNGTFAGGTVEIYMTKEGGRYIVQFPVKQEYHNDAELIAELEKVSKQIKDNVFANNPYSFQMTDAKLNAVKSFDY